MKVGLFDSGIGGLSVLSKLLRNFPGDRYVYVADTLRAPFGTKPEDVLFGIMRDIMTFLQAKGVDVIVAACNTMDSMVKRFGFNFQVPYVGIVDRVAEMARGKRIAVMATEATTRSGIFEEILNGAQVYQKSAQLLVSAIESEPGSEKILKALVRHYTIPIKRWGPDELVLGCTHFPLVKRHISSLLPRVRIIDPADGIVENLRKFRHGRGRGIVEFYVSGNLESFERKVRRFGIHKMAFLTFNKVEFGEGIGFEEAGGGIGTVWGG